MFEHEIPRPTDKTILYYLWQNYFHDSEIIDIKYEWDKITMTLKSIRDIDDFYINSKKSNDELNYLYDQAEENLKFNYQIVFEKCEYYKNESASGRNIFLYGRFKQTSLLQKIEHMTKKSFYHFSIHKESGYFDIICRNIRIKKIVGRIAPKKTMDEDWYIHWLKTNIKDIANDKNEFNLTRLRRFAVTEKNGILNLEPYYSMVYLALNKDEQVLQISRQIVKKYPEDWTETIEPAIWVLGEMGNKNDLKALLEVYLKLISVADTSWLNNVLHPKNKIIEAIEKIQYRLYGFEYKDN